MPCKIKQFDNHTRALQHWVAGKQGKRIGLKKTFDIKTTIIFVLASHKNVFSSNILAQNGVGRKRGFLDDIDHVVSVRNFLSMEAKKTNCYTRF